MRRSTLLGACAVLALAAVAVGSAEPLADQEDSAGPPARQPMPDLLGGGLWRVFTSLAPRTRLDVIDVGGGDRRVLWPPNWWVCTQHPAPGAERAPRGRVVVGVAKKGEPCPPRVTAARR
ncbi:hypothetical protein AB0A60_06060 [Streptomyces sp. NPDC046275]|uniref:hypothetical protein n=1 Tax=Streptomyces sp. NPDC046275 TaxID=3157201 RepID=UPI0033E2260E